VIPSVRRPELTKSMTSIGLFAGIGGIELGLARAGFETEMLCEIDPGARAVLEQRFGMRVHPDIRTLPKFPKVDVVAAGFPCQDLSQAGRTAGIDGQQSGLIEEVFKRLAQRKTSPRWLLLENVPFMLQLQRGKAMRYLVDELEGLGFTWAYRVVNARAFGIPQRRQRVILLASRTEDPRVALFGEDGEETAVEFTGKELCGFYWTEGLRGLGWAVNAVPTLKGGSTIGIPSPPAIWNPQSGSITTPDLRDAERLQGFETDWTRPAVDAEGIREAHRWKLIGNAVSVPLAEWVGRRLANPTGELPTTGSLAHGASWPRAGWGHKGKAYSADVSAFPVRVPMTPLSVFLNYPQVPLSHRAASGFLNRALMSGLRFEDGFLDDMKRHIARMAKRAAA